MGNQRSFYFLVVIQPDTEEGRGYIASVPSLTGCLSQGDTVEEALKNIGDAARGMVSSLVNHNEKVEDDADTVFGFLNFNENDLTIIGDDP